ncbi:MAG: GDSL-type esterase/lipase family protein, partial [Planctomycetota bacterium]
MRTPRSALVLLGLACAPTATSQARVACLGDSITYGARIGDRAHASYPAQLAALRPADDVRNFGVGGATLLARADRPLGATAAFAEALAWRPDVAVVMLGTNDTCQSASRPNWDQRDGLERDARAMVERLRRANPAVRVVLATPPAMFPDRDGLLPPRRPAPPPPPPPRGGGAKGQPPPPPPPRRPDHPQR